MNKADNITLIGMPGAGKSTVGVVLAKILGYGFLDCDLLIQSIHGQTLQDLIDSRGSEDFIRLEGETLQAMDVTGTVISTGGSAVYSEDAMAHLKEMSTTVYLKVAFCEIERRLEDFSERGIVMRDQTDRSLKHLYEERTPLYGKYADIVVDVSDLSITQAARAIKDALERANNIE